MSATSAAMIGDYTKGTSHCVVFLQVSLPRRSHEVATASVLDPFDEIARQEFVKSL
jgi:hypothetical protein